MGIHGQTWNADVDYALRGLGVMRPSQRIMIPEGNKIQTRLISIVSKPIKIVVVVVVFVVVIFVQKC